MYSKGVVPVSKKTSTYKCVENDDFCISEDGNTELEQIKNLYKKIKKEHDLPNIEQQNKESFFKTLKKELVRKNVFLTREIAASKIFEYIEMFYNPKRRYSYLGYISPNEFEKRYNLEASKNKVLTE